MHGTNDNSIYNNNVLHGYTIKEKRGNKKMSHEPVIAFNCDFCNKGGLIESKAGIIYCPYCKKSYGERTRK